MHVCFVCEKELDIDGSDCIGNHICDGCLKDLGELVESLKDMMISQSSPKRSMSDLLKEAES